MPEQATPEFFIDQARPHLGGYIAGGDPATYFPELWTWMVRDLGVTSVLDLGCGEGHALDYFDKLGCRARGIDGVPQENRLVWTHDYTEGPLVLRDLYDLVWSCEFVEHVEERFVPNFLTTFGRAQLVAMTHAEPGQPGYHHVNCQTADYWIGVLASAGLRFDPETTGEARARAALNPNPINHFARAGLVFRRP